MDLPLASAHPVGTIFSKAGARKYFMAKTKNAQPAQKPKLHGAALSDSARKMHPSLGIVPDR